MPDLPNYDFVIDLLNEFAGATDNEFCCSAKESEALWAEVRKAEEIIEELVRLAGAGSA